MDRVRVEPRRRRITWYAASAGVGVMLIAAFARRGSEYPRVDDPDFLVDTVRRGELVRQVHGTGSLVPENVVIVSARTNGRIDQILVQPGQHVDATTRVLTMSNPDVQLQLLEAQRLLTSAQTQSVQLPLQLEGEIIAAEAAVAAARTSLNQAKREMVEADTLVARGLIARNEVGQREDVLAESQQRYEGAERKLAALSRSKTGQIAAQRLEVERLNLIVGYRQSEVNGLSVPAGVPGVVQRVGGQQPLEVGQWVFSGTELARVLQPGRLKALVRVPEGEITDVAAGQPAVIDTHADTIRATVVRVDPASQGGTVGVELRIAGTLPASARPDLSIDATIDVQRIDHALHVGRPGFAAGNTLLPMFRVSKDGRFADAVKVKVGRTSVNQIEILQGLREGDVVVVSDMSKWEQYQHVRLK
jgi:HlyD family secretion protein